MTWIRITPSVGLKSGMRCRIWFFSRITPHEVTIKDIRRPAREAVLSDVTYQNEHISGEFVYDLSVLDEKCVVHAQVTGCPRHKESM